MTFGEFCKYFYKPINGLKGKKSKSAIVKFFLDLALGYETNYDLSYYNKWFNDFEPITIWQDVVDQYKPEQFVEKLKNTLSPSKKIEVAAKFDIELDTDEMPDLFIMAKAISEQFLLIAQNAGSYEENVVNVKYQEYKTPSEWGGYVSRAKDNERICKSLFYRTQGVELDSFYVWNRISLVEPKNLGFDVADSVNKDDDNILEEPTSDQLFEKHNKVLLIGMEGIGKSLMIRKMFLGALNEYHKTGRLPFLIYLREYNSKKRDLLTLIVDAINTYDGQFTRDEAHALLLQGNGVVYMDGLDEIPSDQFSEFHHELERLIKAYKKSCFLITTRNYRLLSAADFKYMWLLPFTSKQSVELIEKLNVDNSVKLALTAVVDKKKDEYKEYLSVPMLLTLLAMNFDRFDTIPSKRHELYEVAYDTLLEAHDRDEKDDYEKKFYSVKDADEFTPIFSEFCARTCRNGEVAFTKQQIMNWLKKISAVHDVVDPDKFNSRNFIDDVCYKACLMYEREREYTFLHRSFQEYLFASFYAYADDERLIKLGEYLSNPHKCEFSNEDAFGMLYAMSPEKVERLIFLPYLKKIFQEYDDRVMFWRYLQLGYGSIRVRYIDENKIAQYAGNRNVIENARVNEPNNFLFLMIIKRAEVIPNFSRCLYRYDSEIEQFYEDVIIGSDMGGSVDLKNIREKLLKDKLNLYEENSISDVNGTIFFGHDCIYDPELAIKEPKKNKILQELIYDKDSEVWDSFDRIRDLYDELMLDDRDDNEDDF